MSEIALPSFLGLGAGCLTVILVLLTGVDSGCVAFAQVTSDGTLSTTVTQTGNNFAIDNGDLVGNNLFHSFSQFSVSTGGSAIFNNATDIQNIFSRVTGGSLSNIDGLIQANGAANLFLLNPSGILFGPNASLNIGGSFIGTTATSIRFADGVEFSAANPTATPLLTLSVPIGLQFGQSPGTIVSRVQPLGFYFGFPVALAVFPGQTLAFIGSDILIEGSALTALDGHLELGSVAPTSFVHLTPSPLGWEFDYSQVQNFRDIALTQASSMSTDGFGGGSITLRGQNISLTDNSVISIGNNGEALGGGVLIRASGTVALSNSYILAGSILQEATGRGGDVLIEAQNLRLVDGSQIGSNTVSAGDAGNLTIRASDTLALSNSYIFAGPAARNATGRGGDVLIEAQNIRLVDGSQIGSNTVSAGDAGNLTIRATDIELLGTLDGGVIASSSLVGATGNGGDLTIDTQRLRLRDGALIAVSTVGNGNSGNLNIRASELLEVSGSNEVDSRPTSLLAGVGLQGSRFGATGQAGSLRIEAGHLLVTEGGQVSTATYENNNAGDLIINADRVEVMGRSRIKGDPSRVTSTSIEGLTAGSVTIQAHQLRVEAGAEVTVSALGSGASGNLRISANSVHLDKGGKLRAESNSGNQGSIEVNAQLLQMRRGSAITTNSFGSSNGGNIIINSSIILGIENSDIIANAIQGQGGNIQIATQGIFGLRFRPQITPENDITASSEFGINGTVQINTIGIDPNAGLLELPVDLVDPSQQIAQGCAANQGSSFVITGRGGIPPTPMTQTGSDRPWTDTRDLSPYRSRQVTYIPQAPVPAPLVEATGWRRNAKGEVEVYVAMGTPPTSMAVTCVPWTP